MRDGNNQDEVSLNSVNDTVWKYIDQAPPHVRFQDPPAFRGFEDAVNGCADLRLKAPPQVTPSSL